MFHRGSALVGMFIGTVATFTMFIGIFYQDIETKYGHDQLVNECQKDLPRDEYCTIIAVPDEDLEE